MDVAARVSALLDTAEAEGGKVIAIQALRQAIDGYDGHVLHARGGRWLLRHPDHCARSCDVQAAARAAGVRWPDGEYAVRASHGHLHHERIAP